MGKQVKTYRATRDGLKVGDSTRNFGDLIPEAGSWENLRAYLDTNTVEEIWVDEEVLNDFKKKQNKKSKAAKTEPADETDSGQTEPKKKVARKPAAKKTVAKKTVTKGKKNVLAEQSI